MSFYCKKLLSNWWHGESWWTCEQRPMATNSRLIRDCINDRAGHRRLFKMWRDRLGRCPLAAEQRTQTWSFESIKSSFNIDWLQFHSRICHSVRTLARTRSQSRRRRRQWRWNVSKKLRKFQPKFIQKALADDTNAYFNFAACVRLLCGGRVVSRFSEIPNSPFIHVVNVRDCIYAIRAARRT